MMQLTRNRSTKSDAIDAIASITKSMMLFEAGQCSYMDAEFLDEIDEKHPLSRMFNLADPPSEIVKAFQRLALAIQELRTDDVILELDTIHAWASNGKPYVTYNTETQTTEQDENDGTAEE